MCSITTSGCEKSTTTWLSASASENSHSRPPTAATRSMSSASTTAWQVSPPIRPRAPITPTRSNSSIVRSAPSLMSSADQLGQLGGKIVAGGVWSHHRRGQRAGQQPLRQRADLFGGDLPDRRELVLDGAKLLAYQEGLADPAHPGLGVLQGQHQGSGELALDPLEFGRGETGLGHQG